MDTYCLILTGEFIDPDPAAARDRLAAAFGMTPEAFDEKVWRRTPLIIRQGLDGDTATRQCGQLGELGARAEALPTEASLIWLLRDERVLGPLPASVLARFGRPGDRWCHDGADRWEDVPGPIVPPPLPSGTEPPPLLATSRSDRRWLRRHGRWLAAAAVTVVAVGIWLHVRAPAPTVPPPVRYVPRPLQPMAASPRAAACADATGAAPASDEDRLLVAGARQLTGRSQREGDNYVAEAVVGRDAQCRPDAVQLYVFHDGVLVGTPLDPPIDPRHTALDFALDAQGQLDYTMQRCERPGVACNPAEHYRVRLQRGDSGWALTYGDATAAASVEILSRTAPTYPAEAVRQRHEGTVLLAFTIGADGSPLDIQVARSSGFAELDAAALAAARQWRFRALGPDGRATTASTRVPVRFHLDKPAL
ncbi:MAG TPA: energy transducer TonB [Dyella sp.]|nr:energy transducer TonB [Dyella sp.]